jgi:hypothetical protein
MLTFQDETHPPKSHTEHQGRQKNHNPNDRRRNTAQPPQPSTSPQSAPADRQHPRLRREGSDHPLRSGHPAGPPPHSTAAWPCGGRTCRPHPRPLRRCRLTPRGDTCPPSGRRQPAMCRFEAATPAPSPRCEHPASGHRRRRGGQGTADLAQEHHRPGQAAVPGTSEPAAPSAKGPSELRARAARTPPCPGAP